MAISDYAHYDGLGLAELVRKGDVKPAELVEEAIRRVEKHNPTINAVIYTMYDQARERAAELAANSRTSPFHGVPFLLKDFNGNHAGVPTANGCRFMTGVPATRDDTLVVRFKNAGLIPLGKTNAPVLAGDWQSYNPIYGVTHNPWDVTRTPGGSSGGSAAALAAGLTPIELGSDIGGSIRVPAAFTGLYGHRPSETAVPRSGAYPRSSRTRRRCRARAPARGRRARTRRGHPSARCAARPAGLRRSPCA